MAHLLAGPDNPPDWCFQANADGQLPTCTWDGDSWHRSYDDGSMGSGNGMGGFAVVFVLALLVGVGVTVWKVSTARRMARSSGMDEGDATEMTLLSDDGFEATYLASNLRPQVPAPQPSASTADRLRNLQSLLDQGLITQEEYDTRRRAVIDGL
ncbi:SHOCT domain-containing protein [Nocardioides sp. URHA0032]|uniref:SHOCT domain-containing protein n=1 Tax=Nocardioides sp. URHA0032 TaxID=1380388 RepID=UPI000490582C|nr:SHOCT domain-containing protein [Nocardioides sp. URHA0032]